MAYLGLTGLLALALVWSLLGNIAIRPVPQNKASWVARHQAIADRLKQGHARVLWIGDSIVQKFDESGKQVWDKYYAPRDAVNMGINGDKTQNVLWRLDHCNLESVSPELAIVMIGQNNDHWGTADQIADGVRAVVYKLRQKLPGMKILLLGIFFRGDKATSERARLIKANQLIAELEDDTHVWYLNIDQDFLSPDGSIPSTLMPDHEHPNVEGCRIWAEAIEPKVAELLGETPIKP